MVEDSTFSLIALEIDMGFGYGRVAQAAYSAGGALKGQSALRTAWAAWERANSMIAKHEVGDLHLRLLGLEAFLRSIDEKWEIN
jgi:hypothetical protein